MTPRLVLVADDDPDTVAAYEVLFRSRGLATEAAADGPAAVFKALELRPDLIVLDLGLPLMDGLEVLRRLRAEGIARIPVLVLTGRAAPDVVAAVRLEGGDDVMIKPCDPIELCERVEMLLQLAPEHHRRGEPSPGRDTGNGALRAPKPRHRRRMPARERPAGLSDEWTTPTLSEQLCRTAWALERRASALRQEAARLHARAIDIRACVALPWRSSPARHVPVSE